VCPQQCLVATCAICLHPIIDRQQVRIRNTEVLHLACARQGGQTVGDRLQREVSELRVQLARERREVEDARTREQQAQVALRSMHASSERVVVQRDRLLVERDQIIADRDRAITERDQALAGGDSHSAPSGDDTETRFAMMELD
jgi:hypothetical protein